MQPETIQAAISAVMMSDEFWSIMLDQSSAQSGPFDGGCLICAKALQLATGGGTLARITSDANCGQTEHYGLNMDGIYFDFDGPAINSEAWLSRFSKCENITDRQLSVMTGYDDDSEIPDDPRAVKQVAALLVPLL